MSKGLSKEDTKQEHPLQAVILCDAWGEEARWGPLVRRSRTEEEEDEGVELGGETRPWVSCLTRRWDCLEEMHPVLGHGRSCGQR